MNFRILGAILRKDLSALYPLALLTAVVFAGDVFILRWDLLPTWPEFRQLLLVVVGALATLAVFQLDAPVSLVDDWLCRPVPRKELVAAKLGFLFLVAYLPGVIATFIADLYLGTSVIEAAQDAVLLRDQYLPLVVPLLLLTALVTRTLVQGIGVLVALLVCMLVIPGPIVKGPDPLSPGIGDALDGAGLGWLAMMPAKLVPLLLAALGFWLVYGLRRILQARILLAITAGMTVFLFVLPMWLLPWSNRFRRANHAQCRRDGRGHGPNLPATDAHLLPRHAPGRNFHQCRLQCGARGQRPFDVEQRRPAGFRAGLHRVPDRRRTAAGSDGLARETQLRAGRLLRRKTDAAVFVAPGALQHGPGACLGAARVRAAKTAGCRCFVEAELLAHAAQAAQFQFAHGRQASSACLAWDTAPPC